MKITIDVGNQNLKIYDLGREDRCIIFENENEISEQLTKFLVDNNVDDILVSSVVPRVEVILIKIFDQLKISYRFIKADLFGQLIDFNKLDYQEMGSDRIVTSYAALKKYGANVAVFDLGTAVTLDVLKAGRYESGLIYPGLKVLQRSIVDSASELYDFSFQKLQQDYRCNDTIAQLNDGIVYGFLAMLKQYVDLATRILKHDYQIIFTGGTVIELLTFISEEDFRNIFKQQIIIDPKLMQDGLKEIYYYLKESDETE